MLVLDTSTLPPGDRAEAYQGAVSANCTVSVATFEDAAPPSAVMHVHDLGPAKVFTIDSSGTTLRRTPRVARAMNDCPIALALPLRSTNRLRREGGDDRFFGARDLMLVDLASPYVYDWTGDGASYAFHVEYDELGLPMDLIRRAVRELRTSPLHDLVRDHLVRVMTGGEQIEASGTAAQVGAASVELMRALIVSAAGDERRTRDALNASLMLRVRQYVTTHVRDPELTPARIAAAHGISVRSLYALFAAESASLEQTIIRQRLDGARRDLAAPSLRHRTIEAVARTWGFTHAGHFSHRFRREFGLTPREWRRQAAGSVH